MNHFEKGRQDTYVSLGLEKVSFEWPTLKSVGEFFIGEPKRFWNELRSGEALSSNVLNPATKKYEPSLIRQSLHMPRFIDKALWWGVPAWQAQQIMHRGGPDKSKELGGLLGSTLAFNALYKPLGAIGSMAAAIPMEGIGRGIGSLFKSKTPDIRPMGFSPNLGDPINY